jgi:predicted phage terminase large subunit-like protein
VGTILHMDSFLERQMPPEKADGLKRGPLSVALIKPDSLWASARFAAHDGDFSHVLWPAKFTRERLEAIRRDYTERGFPEVYAQEYLNQPIDESTSFFRREDFLPIREEDRVERLRYYAAIDFAITQKERADFTVIAVAGLDRHGFVHVVDIRRGRWDALQIIDEMFSVQERYQPDLFTTESGAIEKALGPFLKAEMHKRGVYVNLNPMTPTKDKQSRARSLQARMRAGGVRFDTLADWYPTMQNELLRFPRDVHDDQVDALAWIGLTLDQLIEPPTDEELLDEYYDEMERVEPMGRSLLTGY